MTQAGTPADGIVEMDAMDVAEWEHDQHTPLASSARLAALVKETAPRPPELAPRPSTVVRAQTGDTGLARATPRPVQRVPSVLPRAATKPVAAAPVAPAPAPAPQVKWIAAAHTPMPERIAPAPPPPAPPPPVVVVAPVIAPVLLEAPSPWAAPPPAAEPLWPQPEPLPLPLPVAADERARPTDSLPAVAAPRSRRLVLVGAGLTAVAIAVVAVLALAGGPDAPAPAPPAVAMTAPPPPAPPAAPAAVAVLAPAPVAAEDPPAAVAVEPVAVPASAKPPARGGHRGKPAKKVVLDYDHAADELARSTSAADAAALTRARAAYAAGNQHLFAGEADAAVAAYQQALADYPSYVAGYRGLGLAYAQQGDKPRALAALRTYVATVPKAKDVPLLQRRITRLQAP